MAKDHSICLHNLLQWRHWMQDSRITSKLIPVNLSLQIQPYLSAVGEIKKRKPFNQKIFEKLAIFPHYRYHRMACLALPPLQKLGLINKGVSKLKLPKNYYNKQCAPKLQFFIGNFFSISALF